MENKGLVRGFGSYTTTQLEKTRAELGIRMPISLLTRCATYYRNYLKRDPSVEELKLLDLFSARLGTSPGALSLTALASPDEFVLQTYTDCLRKRKTVKPSAPPHPSLKEIVEITAAYQARLGRRTPTDSSVLIPEDRTACFASALAPNCLSIVGAPSQIRILQGSPRRESKDDDRILLLSSLSEKSPIQYQLAIGELLDDKELTDRLIGLRTVGAYGLLYDLLFLTDSVWLDVSCLSRVREAVPLKLLASGYAGDRLIRVSASDVPAVLALSKSYGVRASVFGITTADGKIRISNQNSPDVLLDAELLRMLCPVTPFGARLESEEPTAPLQISHTCEYNGQCAYLAGDAAPTNESVTLLGRVHAGGYVEAKASPFLQAVYATVAPLCSLAASGCDFADILLRPSMTVAPVSADEAENASAVSALLGFYRVQTELGIASRDLTVTNDERARAARVSVFAEAPGRACPSHFALAGTRVYLWQLSVQANGMPDFAMLRRDLAFISDLRKKGNLLSARLLCEESLTDGLKSMQTEELSCRIKNGRTVSDPPYRLALLLETNVFIPAVVVGAVTALQKKPGKPVHTSSIPAPKESRIWSERPEISLLSAANDLAAHTLTAILNRKGANARLFTAQDSEELSRAILGSQVLILCGKISLPKTAKVSFAVETLHKSGGVILSTGSASQEADFSFEGGIPSDVLDKICSFSE